MLGLKEDAREKMKFAREKRLLLGWLALLVPVPLPLNEVLEWPVLFAYAALVLYFVQRAEDGRSIVLSNGALNLLGLVYLPVLAIDLRHSLLRDQVVRALLHLLLFLLVVKLFAIRKENEKWHVLAAIFFVFVASMATASHMTMVLYLLAATTAGVYAMVRLAHLAMLGAVDGDGGAGTMASTKEAVASAGPLPRARWAAAVLMLLVVVVSIPVFATMPRFRKPWVMGQGGGNLGLSRTTGFSDQVNLSSLSAGIGQNREIALRLRILDDFDADRDAGLDHFGDLDEVRIKGASFEEYVNQRWERPWRSYRTPSRENGRIRLGDEAAVAEIRITLEPIESYSLLLPVQALAVEPVQTIRELAVGPGGDLVSPRLRQRNQAVEYDVLLADGPVIAASGVRPGSTPFGDSAPRTADGLSTSGITPEIRRLAEEVMGDPAVLGEAERARRLERHLLNEYAYTIDFVGREGDRPIHEFLFEHRSGHCELFATSMVLMLRSQGIPARLATGFLGAERNDLENRLVVRQSNAHAWVEAEVGGEWRIFDPTPPEGRPGSPEQDLRLLVQQIYDFVVYRFDRYVLTYGSEDQESFFAVVRGALEELWKEFWPDEPDPELASEPGAEMEGFVVEGTPDPGFAVWATPRIRVGGLLLFLALVVLAAWWIRRPLSAEAAYAALRDGLAESASAQGRKPVDESTPPLEVRRRLLRWVEAAPAGNGDTPAADARRLMDLYLASSFAERPLDDDARKELRPLLRRVLGAVGEVAKARRGARPAG